MLVRATLEAICVEGTAGADGRAVKGMGGRHIDAARVGADRMAERTHGRQQVGKERAGCGKPGRFLRRTQAPGR
eukprot:scaffold11199_cov73-Isochrysis_galbana.AAC.1